MKADLKSLIFGIVVGFIVAVFLIMRLQPEPPPVDVKPFRDSIRILQREKALAAARAAYHIHRADSLEHRLHQNKKKLQHDIQVIEAFTPDLRDRWNDSVLRAAGLR